MNNLELQRKTLKELYDKAIGKYSISLARYQYFSKEDCDELDCFFERTNEMVIENLELSFERTLEKRNNKEDYRNIQLLTPVIVTKKLSQEKIKYLLSLYINKLLELDIYSLGLTSVNISKRWEKGRNIPDEIIYGEDKDICKSNNLYVLQTEFSIIKSYEERKIQKEQNKKYIRMIEE